MLVLLVQWRIVRITVRGQDSIGINVASSELRIYPSASLTVEKPCQVLPDIELEMFAMLPASDIKIHVDPATTDLGFIIAPPIDPLPLDFVTTT